MSEQGSGRFDPVEGQPYGRCLDCGEKIRTKSCATEHMGLTRPAIGGSSHRISVTNPDREARVRSAVDHEVEDAVVGAVNQLWRMVDAGDATNEEITDALSFHDDFTEAWADSVEENS